ncbi:MAG: transporter permease [Clostridia bacterium]|jgi:ABC-2 type transport system permease protein|nr:transporter permease [Clostridia bacterium]
MGFRSSAGILEWFMVFGILGIFTVTAKTQDGAGPFAYLIIFLPFISSAFVPTDTILKVVRAFAEN